MLRIVLSVDCERFISFKQGNPRWNNFEKIKGKINNLIKDFRYNERGFEIVYNTLISERFPATLMIVGSLFKPIKNQGIVEFGYHTLNHLPLTLINDSLLRKEIKNKYSLSSFTAPMWMIEDEKNPKRVFNELKKERYTHCVYRGKNNGIKHYHYNSVEMPVKKHGIICVHVSGFFEGNWSNNKIEEVKEDILKNLNSRRVYLLTTHDFTHKNNKSLLEIIRFLKNLESKKKIKILKLNEIK